MKFTEAAKLRVLYFLVFSCTASWLPIFADFLKERGLTGIQISTILSISPLMMFLVQPFVGVLSDKFGYKRTLVIASFFAAASYVFYLFESSFQVYFVITVCMALFYNSVQPLLDSLSLQLIKKQPGFSYGTLRIAGAAGWAFTGIIVGYYINAINTSVIFIYSAITMLLVFLFAFFLAPDAAKNAVVKQAATGTAWQVIRNRDLIFLLVCVFLVSTGGTTIWNFYSIYMKEQGASAALVGYGISLQGLCELPLFYFSARIIHRFGTKTTLLVTIFATALRMLLYSQIKNPHAALFIELLHGVSWSLFWVVCVEYVNKLVMEEWRATGQSLLYAAYYGLGAIAGNYWTGYLYDAKLKISAIFLLNAGMVFITGILVAIFMRKVNGREQPLAVPAKA